MNEKQGAKQNLKQGVKKNIYDLQNEQVNLQQLKQTLKENVIQIRESQSRIKASRDKQAGLIRSLTTLDYELSSLCIRALNDKLLQSVLQFASEDESWPLVCQQWNGCMKEVAKGNTGWSSRSKQDPEAATDNVLAL